MMVLSISKIYLFSIGNTLKCNFFLSTQYLSTMDSHMIWKIVNKYFCKYFIFEKFWISVLKIDDPQFWMYKNNPKCLSFDTFFFDNFTFFEFRLVKVISIMSITTKLFCRYELLMVWFVLLEVTEQRFVFVNHVRSMPLICLCAID